MHQRLVALLVVAALSCMLVPAAQAQAEAAGGVAYFTTSAGTSDSNCIPPGDVAYTASTTAPAAGKAYLAQSGMLACETWFDYTAAFSQSLTGDMTVKLMLGCDVPAGVAGTPLTSSYLYDLYLNGEDAGANGVRSSANIICTGSPTAITLTFPVEINMQPGDILSFGFVMFAASPAELNMYLATGPTGSAMMAAGFPAAGATGPVTPPTPVGAKTVYGNLTGSAIAISGTFTSPTDDTYVYNWTTTATAVDVAYNATVQAGKAVYTIKDAAGKTVATGTFDKNATKTQPFDKLTAGKWQVTLAYTGFKGVVKLNVSPKGTTGTNGGSGSTGGSGTGNGSGATDKSDGSGDTATAAVVDGQADTQSEASPGIDAVMLAIVGLASVMIARRRLE